MLNPLYQTHNGQMFLGDSEELLKHSLGKYRGHIQLLLTSPPFPLNRKKRYDNLNGDQYLEWLKRLAPLFTEYLSPKGSIVLELGNAWEPGQPTMSTLPLRALLAFQEAAKLYLCQEFICYNPARLPSPAQWVTVERVRVKDAFTRVWWMSPTPKPKADNKKILTKYSKSMEELLEKGTYNPGSRPSEHHIGQTSFLANHGGAIPPNVIVTNGHQTDTLLEVLPLSNTSASDPYLNYCRLEGIVPHPARMQPSLVEFFVRFLTDVDDRVMDPFGGSNVTGFVADRLNRKWISIEKDPIYATASEARVNPKLLIAAIKKAGSQSPDSGSSISDS